MPKRMMAFISPCPCLRTEEDVCEKYLFLAFFLPHFRRPLSTKRDLSLGQETSVSLRYLPECGQWFVSEALRVSVGTIH